MRNPTEFKATPVEHWKPVPHSGPEPKVGRAEKSHPTTATSPHHFKPVKKSGHEGMGDLSRHYKKMEQKSSPVGAGMPPAINKSMPEAPRAVKKFKHTGKDEL